MLRQNDLVTFLSTQPDVVAAYLFGSLLRRGHRHLARRRPRLGPRVGAPICLVGSVEICLDIGRRIVALEGFRYPEDNQDVFRVLAEEQAVPGDMLETLLDMARFGNLIVHDYARIDDARVYGILRKRLSDFDAFAEAVGGYLLEEPDVQ